MLKIIILTIFIFTNALAYQSEDTLKAVIIGKIAKYITWDRDTNKKFVIAVLNANDKKLFDTIYNGKKVKKKFVVIKQVENINKLQNADILYISSTKAYDLPLILKKLKDKNIFTVSDIRGFAQKGGMMQVYFASQKVKLRTNLDKTNESNFKIKSSLLRIADVLREENI